MSEAFAEFRSLFPALKNQAWFASSVQGPMAAPTIDAMQAIIADMREHVCLHEDAWIARHQEIRKLASRLLDCAADAVAFVKNTQEGINWIAEGFAFQPGNNVVGIQGEYPANVYPWMNQRHRGVEFRLVQPGENGRVDIRRIQEACDARTRVLAVSHVEFATGFCNDLATLGEFCRRRDIFFCVDPIQSLGVLPFQARAWGVDALSADGRKWLLGPPGAGLFYLNPEKQDRIRPVEVGALSVTNALEYTNYHFTLRRSARRYEGGDPNWVGIHGLGASLEMLLALGIERIRDHVFGLIDALIARLPKDRYAVFSSLAAGERSGIVSITPKTEDAGALCERLQRNGVIAYPREGRLRVAAHAFNDAGDIDRLLALL